MYRIVFDLKVGAWVIQLSWFLGWRTLTGTTLNAIEPLSFHDFGAAEQYADQIGLNRAYSRQHAALDVLPHLAVALRGVR